MGNWLVLLWLLNGSSESWVLSPCSSPQGHKRTVTAEDDSSLLEEEDYRLQLHLSPFIRNAKASSEVAGDLPLHTSQ